MQFDQTLQMCSTCLIKALQHQDLLFMQDNDLEREFQVHRTDSDYALAEFWKWAISCLIGLSMGCIGFAVDWGINLLNDAKYQSTASVLRSHGEVLLCKFRCVSQCNNLSQSPHCLPKAECCVLLASK